MTTANKSSIAGTPRPDIGAGRRLAGLVDEGRARALLGRRRVGLAPILVALASSPRSAERSAQQMVGATIRTVFAQPDTQGAHEQWRRVSEGFRSRFPRLSELMEEAEEDVLSYAAFPAEHWQKIWSNNPLERLNKEVKRRTNSNGFIVYLNLTGPHSLYQSL
jgi:hypothetical protein